jgi:hypothetical protein
VAEFWNSSHPVDSFRLLMMGDVLMPIFIFALLQWDVETNEPFNERLRVFFSTYAQLFGKYRVGANQLAHFVIRFYRKSSCRMLNLFVLSAVFLCSHC